MYIQSFETRRNKPPSPKQLNSIQHKIRRQERLPRTPTRHTQRHRITPTHQPPTRNRKIIHLPKPPIRPPRHPPRINLRRRPRRRRRKTINHHPRPRPRKRQRRRHPQRSPSLRLRRTQRELDGKRRVCALEQRHGDVAQRAGAHGVGEGTPGGHAGVGGVHAEEFVGVAEGGGAAVVVAYLEEGGVGGEGAGYGGGGGGRGADGDAEGGELEFALVEDLGVGSGFHGGRGEGAGGVGVRPVLVVGVVWGG